MGSHYFSSFQRTTVCLHKGSRRSDLKDSVQIKHGKALVTSKCLGNSRDNQRIFRAYSSSAWRQLPMKMLLRFLVILLPVLLPWSLNEGLGLRGPSITSVDVVEQLGNGIKVLMDGGTDLETKEEVLDCLEDWLGTTDMACNFHKIGGFVAIQQCLDSPHASLRSGGAHLVGEIGQNNPYCQQRFLEEGFLQKLLDQLDEDTDPHCQVKALYAVSCLVRESKQGLAMLANLDGWSVLVRALQKDDTKLRTKGCFFIGAVANAAPEVVEEMVSTGIVLHLATLLEAPHELSHEHVLRAMLSLVQGSTVARKEAQSVQGLLSRLEERLKEVKGRDEGEETEDYCRQLLKELRLEEGVDR